MEHGVWFVLRDDLTLLAENWNDEGTKCYYHFVSTVARSLASSYTEEGLARQAIKACQQELGKQNLIPVCFPEE